MSTQNLHPTTNHDIPPLQNNHLAETKEKKAEIESLEHSNDVMLLRDDVEVAASANMIASTHDEDVVTERPMQSADSNNIQNNGQAGQEKNEIDKFTNKLADVNVHNSQMVEENAYRFPLKIISIDGGYRSFLRPSFHSSVSVAPKRLLKFNYTELREPLAMRWRLTEAINSRRNDSLKYFPFIQGTKNTNSFFPCTQSQVRNSENVNSNAKQGNTFGNRPTSTINLDMEIENSPRLLKGTAESKYASSITYFGDESAINTHDKNEFEYNNANFSDPTVPDSQMKISPGIPWNENKIEHLHTIADIENMNTADISTTYRKCLITAIENEISEKAKNIDLLPEFLVVSDEQENVGASFASITVPMTKVLKGKCDEAPTLTYQEPYDRQNHQKDYENSTSTQATLFPLTIDNKNAAFPQSHKFPSGLKNIRVNFTNANIFANVPMEFSTCHFCHQNFMFPSATIATTRTKTTMTHCPVSNSGHARGIQVQYNDQLLRTIQNGPDLIEIINRCVQEHKGEQQKQEQQHINDAKLATAPMAKNTTAATTSSQNNDEHNIFDDLRDLHQDTQLSAHNMFGKNDERNCLASTTAPPQMSEILAELLQQARDLVDAIGTLNKQTSYADNQQLRIPPTPATCSDVRDSSSQEVSQIREDGVSVKVVTPRTLPEKIKQVKYEHDLELLPKFYALEIDGCDDELIWSKVKQSSEHNTANVGFAKNGRQSANDAKVNVELRIPELQTEVLNDVNVTIIDPYEKTKANILCEFSVSKDYCDEQRTDEMKFETMKNARSKLPESEATRRHSLTYKNESNVGGLGVGIQRPTSLILAEGTRSPLTVTDSKYARHNENQSVAVKSTTTLHGSGSSTVPLSTKYGRTHDQYSGSKPASTITVGAVKDINSSLIETKYLRANDEAANATRSTRAYIGQRTGKLDQKLNDSNDTKSTPHSVIPFLTTGTSSMGSTSIIDTKYNRANNELSSTSLANTSKDATQYGPKNYESSAAKTSNLSTYGTTRPGYATSSKEDTKYGRNTSTAANRSSLLLTGDRSTNPSTFNDSKYTIKQDELSAINHANARSINLVSLTNDTKFAKSNDEPSAMKLSRTDTRSLSLNDSKYAKSNDESSLPRLPHITTRPTDSTPLVESRNVRSYVETPSVAGDIGRSISVDSLSTSLSRSTRLRRQRRMHSQGSQDQGEDPIERLNRLRARISGALTEVKGVLKHYSTETEQEEEVTVQEHKNNGNIVVDQNDDVRKVEERQEEIQQPPEENEGPVKFRFVRKVRRRSFFDEDDEDKAKHEEELEKLQEAVKCNELKEDTDVEIGTVSGDKNKFESKEEAKTVESQKDLKTPNKSNELNNEKKEKEEVKIEDTKSEQSIIYGSKEAVIPELIISKPTDESVSEEKEKCIPISEDIQDMNVPKQNEVSTSINLDGESPKKPKKKLIVKKAVDRRASIAAVEESKIEPPITPSLSLNLKTQRRPSDSEAVVKKKVTPKITATGETATKVKIIHKVKRPSVKHTKASPIDENKAITFDEAAAPTAALHSVNKSSDKGDNNGQANFSNKDGTIATTTTLAPQLVIDDASLTIATTTTTTKTTTSSSTIEHNTNTLPTIERKEASAVIVATTPLSSLRASETNGQLKALSTAENLSSAAVSIVSPPKTTKLPPTPEEIIPPKIPKIDDSIVTPLNIADTKIDERLKLPVAENSVALQSNIQVRKVEEPIDQKAIPADSVVIKDDRSEASNSKQQVPHDVKTIQEAAVTFTSKPPDVISNDIAKETSPSTLPSTAVESIHFDATKADNAATPINSVETTLPSVTSTSITGEAKKGEAAVEEEAMPELQVKTLQAFLKPLVAAPFNITKDECIKKKTVIKKILRKNSTETKQRKSDAIQVSEAQEILKDAAIKDKSKKSSLTDADNSKTLPSLEYISTPTIEKLPFVLPVIENDEANEADWIGEVNPEEEEVELEEVITEEPTPEKKKRRIKKKVIIKRQPRKLSLSDTFFKGPESEPASPIEDILEKPISYVKIDTDEEDEYEEIVKPEPPAKSCLKLREFQVGDRVMYAERYRKTQVRWKKGIVIERITSISYKLEVEGKEVPAHISYIKKYTDRRVNFSGKEYLEINYEQIAEEEEQARRYSIWNMV